VTHSDTDIIKSYRDAMSLIQIDIYY